MKTAVFEIEKWEEEYLKEKLGKAEGKFFKEELNEKNADKVKDCEALCVFIYSKIDKKILDELPKLKYICTRSTGFNHIDIKECKKRGIKVSNVPFYGENTVAEHTFGLILTLSRKLDRAIERTKKDDFSIHGLMGFDLKGKTLGVIGPGHIGQHVIRMAHGFEMNCIAYSPQKDMKIAREFKFNYVSLNELLKKSDIITIHCPLNDFTRHLINMGNVKEIKKGAYLVNTARGEIVETSALKYALDKNILAGAGLDVLEGEEDVKDEIQLLKKRVDEKEWELFLENHLLLKDKDVVVTPHSAFYSKEALCRILDTSVENLNSFKKKKIKNEVVLKN